MTNRFGLYRKEQSQSRDDLQDFTRSHSVSTRACLRGYCFYVLSDLMTKLPLHTCNESMLALENVVRHDKALLTVRKNEMKAENG